jgi:[ribosomal protein S18]-alanine N-acetyltransferase
MIAIRAMAVDDLDRVLSLEIRTPQAPHWDRTVYEHLLNPSAIEEVRHAAWVAVERRELMGFAVARMVLDVCELESIVVVDNMRGKGIGKALLKTVSTWAAVHGAGRTELEVRASNESAIGFYEKAGWRREGLRRNYYRTPEEDAVLMGKILESIAWTVENFPSKTD